MTPPGRPQKAAPYEIRYSSKLKEKIAIVRDNATCIAKDFPYVVYTQAETEMLKGRDQDCIRICHDIKKIFGGTIISITTDKSATAEDKGEQK